MKQECLFPELVFIKDEQVFDSLQAELSSVSIQCAPQNNEKVCREQAENPADVKLFYIERFANYHIFIGQHESAKDKKERNSIITVKNEEKIMNIHFFLEGACYKMAAKNHQGGNAPGGIKIFKMFF